MVTTNHRHYSGTASFPMAHIDDRYVLLEKNGLSNSSRSLLKVHHSEEIAKFHLCSYLHRTIYDCNRIRPIPHYQKCQWSMLQFQQFLQCYNITHQTSSPNHARSNGFVERMVGVAKKVMDKAGKEGKPWISGLFDYSVTPQSGSIASPLQLLTQHTPREKNLPQLPSNLGTHEMYQTHQELMKRQGNTHSRYTTLGSAQAECYMGTSNSDKPVRTKLLLDHAGEWYRTAKSIQVH